VEGLIADDQFTVAAAPDVPVTPHPEPGEHPGPGADPGEHPGPGAHQGPDALPSTGASAHTAEMAQSVAILAVGLGAVLWGAGVMRAGHPGSGRRRHPVFIERSIRSTPVS
jgi:hypothetical protein